MITLSSWFLPLSFLNWYDSISSPLHENMTQIHLSPVQFVFIQYNFTSEGTSKREWTSTSKSNSNLIHLAQHFFQILTWALVSDLRFHPVIKTYKQCLLGAVKNVHLRVSMLTHNNLSVLISFSAFCSCFSGSDTGNWLAQLFFLP